MPAKDVLRALAGAVAKSAARRVAIWPNGETAPIRRTGDGWSVPRPDLGVVSVYPTLWRLKASLRSGGVQIRTLR